MTTIDTLPGYKWRNAWRSPSGYSHEWLTTAADVVRYEQEELNNPLGVDNALLKELRGIRAIPALVWVCRRKKDARRYGIPEKIDIGDDARVVATDGDEGYLVLRQYPAKSIRAYWRAMQEITSSWPDWGLADDAVKAYTAARREPANDTEYALTKEKTYRLIRLMMDSSEMMHGALAPGDYWIADPGAYYPNGVEMMGYAAAYDLLERINTWLIEQGHSPLYQRSKGIVGSLATVVLVAHKRTLRAWHRGKWCYPDHSGIHPSPPPSEGDTWVVQITSKGPGGNILYYKPVELVCSAQQHKRRQDVETLLSHLGCPDGQEAVRSALLEQPDLPQEQWGELARAVLKTRQDEQYTQAMKILEAWGLTLADVEEYVNKDERKGRTPVGEGDLIIRARVHAAGLEQHAEYVRAALAKHPAGGADLLRLYIQAFKFCKVERGMPEQFAAVVTP